MYSKLKNVQILVSLLKKYDIKHIVISAGTRHTPFVHSVENDSFFTTYSIVDERSASFFAIGLIEKLRRPVAIVCTSGTAAANYVSAANEAFYQELPLLLLTADRNHYYMFQQEEQMIPQEGLYSQVCKKVVTLPHVRDDKDFWYCSRICNEALLELEHGEKGPVHINFIVENDYPIYQGIVDFSEKELPDVKKINKITLESPKEEWNKLVDKLEKSKVLIVYGQKGKLTINEKKAIDTFSDRFDCVISTDLLSNYKGDYSINTFPIMRLLNNEEFEKLLPDIVITINANTVSEIKGRLSNYKNKFEHWHISSKGEVSDPFKILSDIISCSPTSFFEKINSISSNKNNHKYYQEWKNIQNKFGKNNNLNDTSIKYSGLYATQQFIKRIPSNSLLHIANSNSIRLANYFELNKDVEVYGNRGTHGIDGSMSAFVGQASITENNCYLLIGDLSFFYDMNALWNNYIGKNIRIMVVNNSGGAIFHSYPSKSNVPTIDKHIAAEHNTSVKDWVISRGFDYIEAHNTEDFNNNIDKLFIEKSNKPIIMEVFTDKEEDAKQIQEVLLPYKSGSSLKKEILKRMPVSLKSKIKKVLK